ncbi:MAG: PhnD/SsuA/transferrin family substrate-binding protein [Sulfuriflexus sp.]|nr:PhnD/SsuA/transferrin family substrate-binding protein [Sulfuriflexus sp.]
MKYTPTITIMLCFFVLGMQQLAATEYTFAVRAHRGVESAHKKWGPTLDVLNTKLPEHVFTLLPILSLNEISERAGKSEFDFLLTNPSSHVEVSTLYGAKALVTLNNKRGFTEQSRFGSVIFTHVLQKDIKSIADLKNKRLMVVSEPAFGGWRVAWLEMLEQGFDPYMKLKELFFTKSKSQRDVVFAVKNKQADAGVVRTDLLERMQQSGDIDMRYFRILNNKNDRTFPFFLSTKLYPEWAISALKKTSALDAQKVKQVLLSIGRESEAATKGKYIGWIESLDYQPVNRLMEKLKVGPYEEK